MISAHLNGGPQDDRTVVVGLSVYYVARPVVQIAMPVPDDTFVAPSMCYGTYRMRLDSLGQPVPHDLTGTAEFDWEGWA